MVGERVPAGKLLRALEGQSPGVEVQAQCVVLEASQVLFGDAESPGHDVHAVVGDAYLLVAVVLDGVVFVEVDDVVVCAVERKLLHVFACGVSWHQGRVDARPLAVFHAALVGVSLAAGAGDVALRAETVLLEVGPSGSLELTHFVPLPEVGSLVVATRSWRISALLGQGKSKKESSK